MTRTLRAFSIGLTLALTAVLTGCAARADDGARPADAARLLSDLAAGLPRAARHSRAVLLGERDPDGAFFTQFRPKGWTDKGFPFPPHGDLNGGPGTRLQEFWIYQDKNDTAQADFEWLRTDFCAELKRMRERSAESSRDLAALAETAARLAAAARDPAAARQLALPAETPPPAGWPGYCLTMLEGAVKKQDLPAIRRWSEELDIEITALRDLHRWLEFLIDNHLANFAFAAECKELFDWHTAKYGKKYHPYKLASYFPGGSGRITLLGNFHEVERQAQRHFRNPKAFAEAAESAEPCAGAARQMPPDLRKAFAALRARLSEPNRAVFDLAAGLPFERSFMANQLDRIGQADALDALGVCLERFDRTHPKSEVAEMMDVLDYKGGLAMAGLEWGDRFDPRVMDAAGKLAGDTPRDIFLSARKEQYRMYDGAANYQGMVLTLRAALDTGKMDCIRGTDLIGALYRNAGQAGFDHIRWSRGDSAHSVAGLEFLDKLRREVLIVDSLFKPGTAEGRWPNDYFTNHPDVHAVELNGRGLDAYVWLEGYIVRGPNAGTLFRTAVPYLPGRQDADRQKVYAGPYPQTPEVKEEEEEE